MGLKGLSKSPSYLLNTKTVLVGLMLQPYDCTHLTNGYLKKKRIYIFIFKWKLPESNYVPHQCSYTSRRKMFIYSSKLELNKLQNYSSDCSEKICKVRYAFKWKEIDDLRSWTCIRLSDLFSVIALILN